MIGPGVFVLVGLWIPASAALAGGVLWFNTRGETLEDGALVRQFMLLLVVAALLLYGIGTRDFVRMRVDPLYRETQLFARHPLPSAMKQWNEADARRLENVVVERLARGGTTAQGLRDARRFLESTGAYMLGFGDDAARLAWVPAWTRAARPMPPSVRASSRAGARPCSSGSPRAVFPIPRGNLPRRCAKRASGRSSRYSNCPSRSPDISSSTCSGRGPRPHARRAAARCQPRRSRSPQGSHRCARPPRGSRPCAARIAPARPVAASP